MCAACSQQKVVEPPSTSATSDSSPASQPSSLPAGHSTSTTAVDLESFFVPPDPLPEVIATVNGEPMSKAAYINQLRQLQVQFKAAGLPVEYTRDDIIIGALNLVTDDILLGQLANSLKVSPDPKAIEEWLTNLKLRMEKDEAFKTFLLRAGKDDEQQRRDAQKAVLYQSVFEALSKKVGRKLQDKAKEYYDRHPRDYTEFAGTELWRIFIRAPGTMNQRDRDIAQTRAKDLYEQAIKDPDNFTNIAKSHSEGGKASTGGYLGYVNKGSVESGLHDLVKKAKSGDILPIWDNAAGFGIYKVGQRRDTRKVPFEEVRESIIDFIFANQVRKEVDGRLDELRKKVELKIHVAELTHAQSRLAERPQPQKPL